MKTPRNNTATTSRLRLNRQANQERSHFHMAGFYSVRPGGATAAKASSSQVGRWGAVSSAGNTKAEHKGTLHFLLQSTIEQLSVIWGIEFRIVAMDASTWQKVRSKTPQPDGLVLGGELFMRDELAKLRRLGQYLRRRNPVPQLNGLLFSLREQRSNFVET